jgi:hypothetical protein
MLGFWQTISSFCVQRLLGFAVAANIFLRARVGQWFGMTLVAAIGYAVSELAESKFGTETATVLSALAIGLSGIHIFLPSVWQSEIFPSIECLEYFATHWYWCGWNYCSFWVLISFMNHSSFYTQQCVSLWWKMLVCGIIDWWVAFLIVQGHCVHLCQGTFLCQWFLLVFKFCYLVESVCRQEPQC